MFIPLLGKTDLEFTLVAFRAHPTCLPLPNLLLLLWLLPFFVVGQKKRGPPSPNFFFPGEEGRDGEVGPEIEFSRWRFFFLIFWFEDIAVADQTKSGKDPLGHQPSLLKAQA